MSGFQGGDIFGIMTNTEVKRYSEIFFSVSKRHRWAVEG